MDDASPELRAEALRRLTDAIPPALTGEGEVDWERLRLEVGDDVGDDAERYNSAKCGFSR